MIEVKIVTTTQGRGLNHRCVDQKLALLLNTDEVLKHIVRY